MNGMCLQQLKPLQHHKIKISIGYMPKDKRNIQPHANKEVKHLMVLLDKSQASEFKKMVPELQDTWVKKQMFRTETEMRFSVLSDNKYGTHLQGLRL